MRTMTIAGILVVVAASLGFLSWQSGGLLQSRALSQVLPASDEGSVTEATSPYTAEDVCATVKERATDECGYSAAPEDDHHCRTVVAQAAFDACVTGVTEQDIAIWTELQENAARYGQENFDTTNPQIF